MRIENLDNNTVKVTLTSSDLINLNIDVTKLSKDSTDLQMFLYYIMETIREKTGFNPYSGKVVVEATPQKGGISILISRVSGGKRTVRKNNKFIRARLKNREEKSIFYFSSFDDMCRGITELNEGELARSALYVLDDTYCFITENSAANKRALNVMSEFSAKSSKYPMQLSFIKEHGSLVASGKTLYTMAINVRSLID